MPGFSYTAFVTLKNIPPVIDVRAFAQAATRVSGQAALTGFSRLLEEAQGDTAGISLRWSAQGEMRAGATGGAEPWLHLTVDVSMALTCQRCLGPVETPLRIERSFRFVETEALAEAQDEDAEEDVLVLSADFSLASLLEDEVLLALPLIPRHETCPAPVRLSAQDPAFAQETGPERKPFAALAAWAGKGGKSSH